MADITIEDALTKRHSAYDRRLRRVAVDGILVFELATGTGFMHGEPNRIDAFHMADVPSKGFLRTAYEIKKSRADFLREIRAPLKRRAALRVSNQFFFATTRGVAKSEEVPLECGLLEMDDNGHMLTVVNAPHRDGNPASWAFFASFARRVQRAA